MNSTDEPEQGKQRDPIDIEPSDDQSDEETSDVDDGSGNWESAQEGWQVYQNSDQETSEVPEGQPLAEQSAPSEAPPLPEGGLPDGWTMDQWRWYGHEWLEKNSK